MFGSIYVVSTIHFVRATLLCMLATTMPLHLSCSVATAWTAAAAAHQAVDVATLVYARGPSVCGDQQASLLLLSRQPAVHA